MPKSYPPHMLVSFGGYLGTAAGAQEEWSCGLRVVSYKQNQLTGTFGPKNVDREAQENYLNDITEAIKVFINSSETGLTEQAKLTYVKCNAIAPDGKYLFGDVTSANYFSPIPGFSSIGTEFKPLQVARVVTLRTSAERGLASRGRIYLPCPGGFVDANGYSIPATAPIAASMGTLINAMNIEDAQNTYRVAVVSGGSVKFNKSGIALVVRSVEVGNVLDTQRRRRESLLETRGTAPVDFATTFAPDPA